MSFKKSNLDVYLAEVFKQFVTIKDDDFKRAQEVFNSVFKQVKQKMGEQCNFFNKYSSQVMYSGSVYDGVKVSKLDEFDMDIVIRLPISYEEGENGIIIENDQPGFVRLKIINAFDHMDKQPDWEKCHKVTRDWRDSEKYFLQNKFRHWLHSIVQKALNEMQERATVNGVTYSVKYKESGPAFTLNIRNEKGDEEFKLDVDLVPVIRFMYPRWPPGYRTIHGSQVKDWLVVPKPIKNISNETVKSRCWRLSFQDYERELLKECHHLKTIIKLIKKLREALGMKEIASYYIKTLFLWKIERVNDKKYWQNKLSVIFRSMVEDLYNAIKAKNIPYFWNEKNNLIGNLKPTHQKVYMDKLKVVLDSIDANDVNKTVVSLLTDVEMEQFKCSEFYLRQLALTNIELPVLKNESICSTSSSSQEFRTNSQTSSQEEQHTAVIRALMEKIDLLTQKVNDQEGRINKLEEMVACKESTDTNPLDYTVKEQKVFDKSGDRSTKN
ncbi:unnamed protein product [Parnassius apollo]|uniref:(apollo) hypothetical protein n=1 Tax=Parnassius apollo TaxID=110799 RepID=A0A8S3WWI4_PARAO|nr:unnamed protein product [Parnassius apollo]